MSKKPERQFMSASLSASTFTADHKLAHSRGGGNAEDNLQVLTKKEEPFKRDEGALEG